MSQFYLPSASTTATPASPRDLSSDDDEDTLPYPAELSRRDFLASDFDPARYLSTLRNRHQTLEDLRSDLRARSQLLNKELLDLVNGNYEEFLALGGDLRGGDEKVEEVRVGLLSFQREIETLKRSVRERAEEVKRLLDERKTIRRDVALARDLLEVADRISELENDLGMNADKIGKDDLDDHEEEDEEEDEEEQEWVLVNGLPVGKLQRRSQQYRLLEQMITHIGSEHPFLVAQQSRLQEVKKTILMDLAAVLRQARVSNATDATLAIISIYGDLDAQPEGIRILKGS